MLLIRAGFGILYIPNKMTGGKNNEYDTGRNR